METLAKSLTDALSGEESLVLADPAWPADWKRRMQEAANALPPRREPVILIPTSGTTGTPKYCIHNSATLMCAARGYAQRFGSRGIIHAVNVLPLHHVGGLMPVARASACGGSVHFADYRNPASITAAPFDLEQASISLVPTQLRRMLGDHEFLPVLRRFALILVGGAACPAELLERARACELRLAPCYGSTETAAMVTALDPEDFLAGASNVGMPLPHARLKVDDSRHVQVYADSLLLGYLPPRPDFCRSPFFMGDLGELDADGRLHLFGRIDTVIITGGKKVHPAQVEEAALASGWVSHAKCLGCPDEDWGTRIELVVVGKTGVPDFKQLLLEDLKKRLPAYAVPKIIRGSMGSPLAKG